FAYITELIHEVIVSDALPPFIQATPTQLGRVTKSAAYMLKAKPLVYWASPLFNGNTDYNSCLDENGDPFFDPVYDATRWDRAAEACRGAIEICEQSGIRLYHMEDYVTSKPISDT